jgi:hypothetical protein
MIIIFFRGSLGDINYLCCLYKKRKPYRNWNKKVCSFDFQAQTKNFCLHIEDKSSLDPNITCKSSFIQQTYGVFHKRDIKKISKKILVLYYCILVDFAFNNTKKRKILSRVVRYGCGFLKG